MSAHRVIVIRCDGGDLAPGTEWPAGYSRCEATFGDPDIIQTNADVRKAAKKVGWVCKNGWDHCHNHKDQAS